MEELMKEQMENQRGCGRNITRILWVVWILISIGNFINGNISWLWLLGILILGYIIMKIVSNYVFRTKEERKAIETFQAEVKRAKILKEDGYLYEGDERKGTKTWTDGSKYVGHFEDGNRHGKGILTYSDGSKYEGEWKNDRYDKGTCTYSDGSKYVGHFKRGKKHGMGTRTYSDGSRYVGHFKRGKKHGMGIHTYSDGSKYEGGWNHGIFHGQGILTITGCTPLKRDFSNGLCIDLPRNILISTLGKPGEIKDKVTKEGKTEKMKFGQKIGARGGIKYEKEVIVENDKVVGWQDL